MAGWGKIVLFFTFILSFVGCTQMASIKLNLKSAGPAGVSPAVVQEEFQGSVIEPTPGTAKIIAENVTRRPYIFVTLNYTLSSSEFPSLGRRTVTMQGINGLRWEYSLPQTFKKGDLISYYFTYALINEKAKDSRTYSYRIVTAPIRTVTPDGYKLVFSDEFDKPALNPKSWNTIIDGRGGGNYESQFYTADSVTILPNQSSPTGYKGLALTITPIVRPDGSNVSDLEQYKSWDIGAPNPDQPYQSQRFYKSGKVTTQKLRSFQYGLVEVRAKAPPGTHTWPAIWMLPEKQDGATAATTWPNLGEIDIMEIIGKDRELNGGNTTMIGSLNYGDYWKNAHYTNVALRLPTGEFSDDFHVFSVKWMPNKIEWYLDGRLYSTKAVVDLDKCQDDPLKAVGCKCAGGGGLPEISPPRSCPWDFGVSTIAQLQANPTHQNQFYIILNSAIGGNLGGKDVPPLDQVYKGEATWETINPRAPNYTGRAPQVMVIDYVRVYQLEGSPSKNDPATAINGAAKP